MELVSILEHLKDPHPLIDVFIEAITQSFEEMVYM